MTREEIIRMAREAGLTPQRDEYLFLEMLERIATLVTIAERERERDTALLRQALEAMLCAVPTGKITLANWHNAIAALRERLGEKE